jgi:hypothetical protein
MFGYAFYYYMFGISGFFRKYGIYLLFYLVMFLCGVGVGLML